MQQTPAQPIIGISQTIENQTFVIENELLVDDFPLRLKTAKDFEISLNFLSHRTHNFCTFFAFNAMFKASFAASHRFHAIRRIYRFTERPIDDPVIGKMFLHNLSHHFWFIHQRFRGEPQDGNQQRRLLRQRYRPMIGVWIIFEQQL